MDSTIKKSNEKPINILLKNDLKKKTTSTVPKSNRKIIETTAKSTSLTHIYMTAHFAGLMQALDVFFFFKSFFNKMFIGFSFDFLIVLSILLGEIIYVIYKLFSAYC
jgi:hypothetical protein